MFQGAEFGQSGEWNFEKSLDWHLTQYDPHKGIQETIKDLNKLYRKEPAMHQKQFSVEGFEWIDYGDASNSVLVFIRKGNKPSDDLIIACNMTPIPRENYRIGLLKTGQLKEIFISDLKKYHGSGEYKNTNRTSEKITHHSRPLSTEITIPPLGMIALKYVKTKK